MDVPIRIVSRQEQQLSSTASEFKRQINDFVKLVNDTNDVPAVIKTQAVVIQHSGEDVVRQVDRVQRVQTPILYTGINYTHNTTRVLIGPTYNAGQKRVGFMVEAQSFDSSTPRNGLGAHFGIRHRFPGKLERVQGEVEAAYCLETGEKWVHAGANAIVQSGQLLNTPAHYAVTGKAGLICSTNAEAALQTYRCGEVTCTLPNTPLAGRVFLYGSHKLAQGEKSGKVYKVELLRTPSGPSGPSGPFAHIAPPPVETFGTYAFVTSLALLWSVGQRVIRSNWFQSSRKSTVSAAAAASTAYLKRLQMQAYKE